MKPEVSTPQFGPEQLPVPPSQNVERGPQYSSPESGVESGAERKEQASELNAVAVNATSIAISAAPQVQNDDVATIATGTMPIVAGDDDLIEKEWVDQAKKIIVETKDDPYAREKAVAQLQANYLRKRYGREPGAAN